MSVMESPINTAATGTSRTINASLCMSKTYRLESAATARPNSPGRTIARRSLIERSIATGSDELILFLQSSDFGSRAPTPHAHNRERAGPNVPDGLERASFLYRPTGHQ